jgi:hypothetical protein
MMDRHCPFLNRDDPRCAAHFRVNHLQNAFDHCAGEYAKCSSYRELLAERIMRRAAAESERRVELSVGGQAYAIEHRTAWGRPVERTTHGASFAERESNAIIVAASATRWRVSDAGVILAAA